MNKYPEEKTPDTHFPLELQSTYIMELESG